MAKIIFLDVDGVLNCKKTWSGPHKDGMATLCPDMCDRLGDIVKQTKAIVVLSSSWRLMKDSNQYRKLVSWLAKRDISIHSHTKWLSSKDRGHEIAAWLEDHEHEFPRKEVTFVILDDDSDMLYWQRSSFVHTSFKDGLTERHAAKAIRILNE
jgi:hypothetical protein